MTFQDVVERVPACITDPAQRAEVALWHLDEQHRLPASRLITPKVAIADFQIPRATLFRAIRRGELRAWRPRARTLLLDRGEVGRWAYARISTVILCETITDGTFDRKLHSV